jgi:hypothetical protein
LNFSNLTRATLLFGLKRLGLFGQSEWVFIIGLSRGIAQKVWFGSGSVTTTRMTGLFDRCGQTSCLRDHEEMTIKLS